jgi:polysaccharide export outer membrane protein
MARGQTAATGSGIAGPGVSAAPVPPDSYRICPGDTLSVSVDGDQVLTRDCQVNGAGTISYPLLGDVKAAGETCSSLSSGLTTGLTKYLNNPRVTVTVRQYGTVGMSVFVMGEVAKPGVYPLASGSGIMQPLASAGGVTDLASGEITILKTATGESRTFRLDQLNGSTDQPALLQPGDVILVNRKMETRYSVLGEVPAPGMFDMPGRGDVRVLDAMTKCGLLQQNADPSHPNATPSIVDNPARTADLERAVLTRGETKTPLNLAALLQGDTSQNIVLQPGDVLTVPRRPGLRAYALGEVRNPGRLYLPENATVLDLLNAAGGTTSTAQPGGGAIVRMVDGKPTSLRVDLGQLLSKGDAKQNIALREGDVLFVPSKGSPNDSLWRLLWVLPRFIP